MRIDFVDSFVYFCVFPRAAHMNVAHLLSVCFLSSTSPVSTSVFISPLFANSCTCHRPIILTMTDHHC